ncbi:MATE family efflux transporter [[Clostridium] symbiosum]|uniref:MATE family efflux transporter n=1 Tax=Clostridium symbiosum TaxID=1512 RepID=UPI001D07FD0E|nr:MATE family efflux transporter [[Clostridium] symbiosum]MCB6608081.1 MATE family efflux transporter [[Clostridium] symbiosum]MCB6931079.1 MATE family efflux transporter [[Clostridium] symbiosum]
MQIQLSEHFTYKKLLQFVLPSIIMMVFTSIYSIVDGLFVSNFVGKTPFAAINMVMPVLTILGSFGFMIGAGGTAIVGKTLGEGDRDKANRYFSMLIYVVIGLGIVFAGVGLVFMRPLASFLGASGDMLEYCVLYGRGILAALPFFMLQNSFQNFFVMAEKPNLGLGVTVISGVLNIVLDALFIIVFKWGLFGAAFATAFSQAVGAGIALVYFTRKNGSLLRLTPKTGIDGKVLWKACTNGSSEMVGNLAASVVTMLYNFQLMRLIGEDGVAAFGVIAYFGFIFSAIFYGYAVGCSPIVSYQFGADNQAELKNLLRKSLGIIGITGIAMVLLSRLGAVPLSKMFVGYDEELFKLTVHGFKIYSVSFLFSGFSAFGSAFFTALNDGLVSAVISFLRTFVFEIGSILILPFVFGVDGIWTAIVVAELAALTVTIIFLVVKRKKYHYA